MAKMRFVACLVAGLLACLPGCGTIANFASGGPEMYGGLDRDFRFFQTVGHMGKGGFIWLLAELTLSGVADTLTLPLVIWIQGSPRLGEDEMVPADGRGDSGSQVQFSAGSWAAGGTGPGRPAWAEDRAQGEERGRTAESE
jgi:hypothetical protein